MNVSQSRDAWSRLWRSGSLHSCVSGEGVVFSEDFWRHFFCGSERAARVLDVGTGNGLIPLLAARHLHGRGALICGIDAAQIGADASKLRNLDGIYLLSGISAERMPFVSASFDLVTAQFALEYTDVDVSLNEVVRVLAPGGRIGLVIHVVNSRITEVSRMQLEHIEWLLRPDGFLEAARRMAGILRSRRQSGEQALHESVRAHYNQVANALIQKIERGAGGDVLARAAVAVQRELAVAAKTAEDIGNDRFGSLILDLESEALRLREQVSAARTSEQLGGITGHLQSAGMRVEIGELHHQGHLMGMSVVAWR